MTINCNPQNPAKKALHHFRASPYKSSLSKRKSFIDRFFSYRNRGIIHDADGQGLLHGMKWEATQREEPESTKSAENMVPFVPSWFSQYECVISQIEGHRKLAEKVDEEENKSGQLDIIEESD
eukprot:GHVH01015769.1.p2 GENE.GHVH01015769.1~~GHVH01015769.1.p2  ORF type:complete len:123 (-),score=13.82 GHVH01015769.1:700-1068(-)